VLQRALRGAPSPSLEPTAEQHLLAALAAPKPDLRGRAASAVVAVAAPQRTALRAALTTRLEAERDRRVHVLLALALDAEHALLELMRGQDMPAAQAAAELSSKHPEAFSRLRELAQSNDASIRATASAALARAYDFAARATPPTSVRALLDPDARVRAGTAAALLQAIERLQAPR
jgi:HEAT repeat protein